MEGVFIFTKYNQYVIILSTTFGPKILRGSSYILKKITRLKESIKGKRQNISKDNSEKKKTKKAKENHLNEGFKCRGQ